MGRRLSAAAVLLLLLIVLSATASSSATAHESTPYAYPEISGRDIEEASRSAGDEGVEEQLTDSEAAENLPHNDLDRDQAVRLLNSVFELPLEGRAGIYDELDVKRFLSNNAAIIPAGQQPESPGISIGEEAAGSTGPTLLESSAPLRAKNASGEEEAVNLGLEHVEGELQPANPIVEVGIPQELGEGIEIGGEAGEEPVRVQLVSAPQERAPSTIDESVAVYPNVGTDTDLAVAPTPEGVETLTQLRTAEAPTSQTFRLELPAGASLQASPSGGAEVVRQDGKLLLRVLPPSAIDAEGNEVPVSMSLSGDTISLRVSTSKSTAFPVLVDPLYQTYRWYELTTYQGTEDFSVESNEPSLLTGTYWSAAMPNPGLYLNSPGLYVQAHANTAIGGGASAAWSYYVPRLKSDEATYHDPPHTYISGMHLHDLGFFTEKKVNGVAYSDGSSNPHLWSGIWDGANSTWPSSYFHDGPEGQITNFGATFDFSNSDENAKIAEPVALSSYEWRWMGENWREAYAGYVGIEVSEAANAKNPTWGPTEGPGWVNATATKPIEANATDLGLGVKSIVFEGTGAGTVASTLGCSGLASSPCPRVDRALFYGYEPAKMPQGIDYVNAVAEDVLANRSAEATPIQVKVDHTAPTLSVTGSLTEQATRGTGLESYTLNIKGTDGTATAPQSGVVKSVIKVDGQVADEYKPGCPTKSCELEHSWSLEAAKFLPGKHTVEIVVTDGVGLTASKSFAIELEPDHLAPTVTLSGSMTEQSVLGSTLPRYSLKLNAADPAEPSYLGYTSSFGSGGSGNGQFLHPADVAVGAKGNLWAVDMKDSQIEKFNGNGEFLATYGSSGAGNGQFSRPTQIAIANGNVFVADSGNKRIEKFNEAGEFLKSFGSLGTGNGQFSGSGPEGIAVDGKGDVWVSDTFGARIEKFNEAGEFLKAVGTRGTGSGQLVEPAGIDVDSKGDVWVADRSNNKVVEFDEAGEFVRQFGSKGTGNGQFSTPDALDVDSNGNVWVGDQNNGRVEEFGPTGEYISQFGSRGTGAGQFSFSYPFGIETAPGGIIWVADPGNNRIEKWAPSAGSPPSGVAATTIKLDGNVVDSTTPGCPAGGCSISREWTLNSSAHPGTHTVEAIAVDAAGHSTTETLTINIAADEAPPQISANSAFFNAPEGWVEQQAYPYSASASDPGGYGATSMVLKVDGAVVNSASQSCPAGACEETLSGTINTANYSGGAHSAELIATDGAGNTARKAWTMNVDPHGAITAQEAADTLEALEETSEGSPVAPAGELLEPEEMEMGDDPALVKNGDTIESTGVPDSTEMATDPAEGFTVSGPAGDLTVEPVGGSGGSMPAITKEVAAVSGNQHAGIDSVVRPEFNGALAFQEIREPSSPETYSWKVRLSSGQELIGIDELHAEVRWQEGPRAYLITAEEAHDATGKAVATSLAVEDGDILTLTVKHRAGSVVYPVLAGQAYETSYHAAVVTGPLMNEEEPPPSPPAGGSFSESEGERMLRFRQIGSANVSVPEPVPPGNGASASKMRVATVEPLKVCQIDHCSIWWVELHNPSYFYGYSSRGKKLAEWEPETQVHCTAWSNIIYYPELEAEPWEEGDGCDFHGKLSAEEGEGRHMTAYGRFVVKAGVTLPDLSVFVFTERPALQIWVWPNGYQQRIVKTWETGVLEA